MAYSAGDITERVEILLNNIREHATKVGRDPCEVKLVAVTKGHPVEAIFAAIEAGLRVFGENYAQEMRAKASQVRSPVEWHFIGRIQTNKVKYIVPIAEYIHSVWRLEELIEIDKVASKVGKVQKVLVEVNVSGEETKAGVAPERVKELLLKSSELSHVNVVGLMTMAPYVEPEATRPYFRKLRELRDTLIADFPDLVELSMGMSNDYWVAVEEGSTMVRIGTAIFGERS